MTFVSFRFIIFFSLTVILYYSLPLRYRKGLLLVAGYYFYMCFRPEYVVILAATTLIDFKLAAGIEAASVPKSKKRLLLLGLFHNIGLLAAFKYLTFFSGSVSIFLNSLGITVDLEKLKFLLPVGISYYTFKKISYLVDVYRGTQEAETSLINFSLYISFFPSIMAGPIDRAAKLLPQFRSLPQFDYQRVTEGMKLIAWGIFKKVVIADRLAVFVNQVYSSPSQYQGISLAAATVYFSIVIYCDFSGYTDMALGIAKVMGFELTENFNRPYFATSIGEFWKRWHISLSQWLMEYLFLPIAYRVSRGIVRARIMGVKAETWAYLSGIMITMILCGIWHGSGLTFLVWGALHGLFLALSFVTKKKRRRLYKKLHIRQNALLPVIWRALFTFSTVTFAWIFFRAESMTDAFDIISRLFTGWGKLFQPSQLLDALRFGLLKKELAVAGISVLILLLVHLLRRDDTFEQWLAMRHRVVRWSFYVGLLLWILTFGDSQIGNFIYFGF